MSTAPEKTNRYTRRWMTAPAPPERLGEHNAIDVHFVSHGQPGLPVYAFICPDCGHDAGATIDYSEAAKAAFYHPDHDAEVTA